MTQMHVVRLLAPRLDDEDQSKDVDFSQAGIRSRWDAGLASTRRAIEQAPWQGAFDPIEGVILHEPEDGGIAAPAPRPAVLPAPQQGTSALHGRNSTAA